VSDFTAISEGGITFSKIELDSGVDFSNQWDADIRFSETGSSDIAEFSPTGDAGKLVLVDSGFGEGGFGEGPFGGGTVVEINQPTIWSNVGTP
jgi:hypothetical protein